MTHPVSRREIIKLSSLLPLAYIGPRILGNPGGVTDNPKAKNILIIVFDAWSARHIPLYGYQRDTTPNLSRLADKAIVYHNHYAAAPWTAPGTGSLLTGVYPWTHRAYRQGRVFEPYTTQNMFSEFFNNHYYTFGYSHNKFADELLAQFSTFADHHLPISSLYLNTDPLFRELFEDDADAFHFSRTQILFDNDKVANSLFLSPLVKAYVEKFYQRVSQPYLADFSQGAPFIAGKVYNFLLEDGINWLNDNLPSMPQPFLGYFHFYPPHAPYTTRNEFHKRFDRTWRPVKKPKHLFTHGQSTQKMSRDRAVYDEYILYLDAEFGRLMKHLDETGILEDSWVILTSDHGELFERGVIGHATNFMYEPVTHIPLVIFEPERKSRMDVFERTSAIDILPSLLQATGHQVPTWIEGRLLPPFSPSPLPERNMFSIQPRHSAPDHEMREGTLVLYKENYKLIYYFGHEEIAGNDPYFELYDVIADPEELDDLYPSHKQIANELFSILEHSRKAAESPYNS